MKKTFAVLALGVLIFQFSFGQQKKTTTPVKPKPKPTSTTGKASTPVLKNAIDSLSYSIGLVDGNFFKMQGIDKVNPELIAKGFSDIYNNASMMTPEQADVCIRTEMQKMNRRRIQPELDAGSKFLAENRKKQGVVQLPSGLQYEVIKMGTGPKPSDTNVVKVHYEGFLRTGTKFESSKDRGQPISMPLSQFIRGWQEGIQLMPVGSVFKFYIPPHLGYGEVGSPPTIPGGATLIFEVELLGIDN